VAGRTRRAIVLLLLACGLGPREGRAQTGPALHVGTRVRVEAAREDQLVTGRIWQVTRSTLTIRAAGRFRQFALADIQDLEVSRGRDNSALVGAIGGLLGGAAVGGFLGYEFCVECAGPKARAKAGVELGAGFGAAGLVGGLVIGALVSSERWERATIRPEVTRESGAVGWGFRVSWRF
jgi:hypothetical protein